EDKFAFRLKHFFLPAGELRKDYIKYSIPVLVSDTLLGISLALTGVIVGHISAQLSAANSIVNSMVQLSCVLNSAMSGASAVIIGNTIGEGDIPRAKREGNSYVLLSFLIGLIIVGPMLLLEKPYISLYNIAEETRAMIHGMFILNAFMVPVQTIAFMTSKGILRGGGDTRFLLLADSTLVWIVSLPLGTLAGLVWHMSPVWIYFFLRIEFPLKGIVCLIRFLSGKWIKVISLKGPEAPVKT
ncbi:MAG: hypothetical protein HUJ65_07640, partial [Oscillospiraceae bacterium]|nr:hypothetical protein [Oscillospiraceae bacterium]